MAPEDKRWEVHGTWNAKNGRHSCEGFSAPSGSVAARGSPRAKAHVRTVAATRAGGAWTSEA